MEMRQEYMAESRELEPLALEGILRAFAAVNHEEVSAMVDDGGGWLMVQSRLCGAAAEGMNRECRH